MTTCEWTYGEKGTGKSKYAFKDYDPSTHYILNYDKGWWDGYTGQDIVLMNEFHWYILYKRIIHLIFKFPEDVRRRGKEPTPFLAKHIKITSRLHPKYVYYNRYKEDSQAQLYRRMKIGKSEFSELSS